MSAAHVQRLQDERPEEVWMAPPELNLAQHDPQCQLELETQRRKQGAGFLRLCRRIWDIQQGSGRRAHIEHPRSSSAW